MVAAVKSKDVEGQSPAINLEAGTATHEALPTASIAERDAALPSHQSWYVDLKQSMQLHSEAMAEYSGERPLRLGRPDSM